MDTSVFLTGAVADVGADPEARAMESALMALFMLLMACTECTAALNFFLAWKRRSSVRALVNGTLATSKSMIQRCCNNSAAVAL